MTDELQQSATNGTENASSEQLAAILGQLTTDQIRYVIARQECGSDKEAAKKIGIGLSTVYHWPETVREAVRLMAADGLTTALHLRKRNLAKAMMVKADGLDSRDEKVRQGVATEIIEWETGKAAQPVENSGLLVVEIVRKETD